MSHRREAERIQQMLSHLRAGWVSGQSTASPARRKSRLDLHLNTIREESLHLLEAVKRRVANISLKWQSSPIGRRVKLPSPGVLLLAGVFAGMIVIGAGVYVAVVSHILDPDYLYSLAWDSAPQGKSNPASISTPGPRASGAGQKIEWHESQVLVEVTRNSEVYSVPNPGNNGPAFLNKPYAPGAINLNHNSDTSSAHAAALPDGQATVPLTEMRAPAMAAQPKSHSEITQRLNHPAPADGPAYSGKPAASLGTGTGVAVFPVQHLDRQAGTWDEANIRLTTSSLDYLPEGSAGTRGFTIPLASITSVQAARTLVNVEYLDSTPQHDRRRLIVRVNDPDSVRNAILQRQAQILTAAPESDPK